MSNLPADSQLRLYSAVRQLESRTAAFEALVGRLRRACVHGSDSTTSDMIATASDLGWQLRLLFDYTQQIRKELGVGNRAGNTRDETAAPTQDDAREVPDPAGLRGSIETIAVADLVGMLSTLGKTGTLALNADDVMYVFELQQGKVVHAVTNQKSPELRLGTILVAHNKLSPAELQANLDECATCNELLGAHLVKTATVSESDLREALDVQVHRIFEQAFRLRNARFSFVEGSLSAIAQRATINTTELLLDAARLQDQSLHEAEKNVDPVVLGALDTILGG